jgi:hypothetical protein
VTTSSRRIEELTRTSEMGKVLQTIDRQQQDDHIAPRGKVDSSRRERTTVEKKREIVNINTMSIYCIDSGVSRVCYMSGSRQIPVCEEIGFSRLQKDFLVIARQFLSPILLMYL